MIIQSTPPTPLSQERFVFILIFTVFTLGTFTLLSLTVGACIVALYLVNLSLTSLTEVCQHLALVYSQSDSFVKLIMWFAGFLILYKVGRKAFAFAVK